MYTCIQYIRSYICPFCFSFGTCLYCYVEWSSLLQTITLGLNFQTIPYSSNDTLTTNTYPKFLAADTNAASSGD